MKITVRIPDELYDKLRERVKRDGMTQQAAVAKAIELWLKS